MIGMRLKTTIGIHTKKNDTLMYKQGDIILMPFPNDDFLSSKQRPAIIIGKNRSRVGSYIVAKITSVLRNDDQSFELLNTDISMPLRLPSEVRCDSLMTVAESLIIKKITVLKFLPLKSLCNQIKQNIDVV
jgi:mRNA interferase MazF